MCIRDSSSTGAWAKKYEIQVSDDNEHFKTICRNNNGRYDPVPENGTRDAESFRVSGQGRYIRMQSLEEGKVSSGSSIREFRVWGTPTGTDAAGDYANILNTVDNKFSDMGAWFGFRLPSGDDTGTVSYTHLHSERVLAFEHIFEDVPTVGSLVI